MALLEKRRESMVGKQINNDRLPAGSPMYYYCHGCGVLVSVKPEGWYLDPPPKNCDDCKALIDDGLIDSQDTFHAWARVQREAAQ
jgi:hypothetical protein